MIIECDKTKLPDPADIINLRDREENVVLILSDVNDSETRLIIQKLAIALSDCSVFLSARCQISILNVVGRQTVKHYRDEIKAAVNDYIQLSHRLMAKYRQNSLSYEWVSFEHGEHRQFLNTKTGQEIEALLASDWTCHNLDPYFFSRYVKTSSGYDNLKSIIKRDYHDSRRIMDLLF